MHTIEFRYRQVTRILFALLGGLLLLHLVVAYCHLVLHVRVEALTQLADFDLEANLPTFFNALLFFLAGALFALHGKAAPRQAAAGWYLLAGLFIFLGFDEGSQVHEKLMGFTARLLRSSGMDDGGSGWLFNAWVIPYVLALLGLVIVLRRWLLTLERPMLKGLLISGAVYVLGAAGCEMAAGRLVTSMPGRDAALYPWLPCNLYGDPAGCWLFMEPRYILLYTMEELGEMIGLILCIGVLLRGIEAKGRTVVLGSLPDE
ncbi:MAG: hypothetical protein KJZ58_00850 [Flavobacteriales bacterium]|nr:hypothetical protein [Flavobacteriales bacterium]MCL4280784.1 hypothetical protein [Flavobacteriales bacterium]